MKYSYSSRDYAPTPSQRLNRAQPVLPCLLVLLVDEECGLAWVVLLATKRYTRQIKDLAILIVHYKLQQSQIFIIKWGTRV